MRRVSQERLRRKDGDKSRMQQSTSRATRGVEENKTRLRRRQVYKTTTSRATGSVEQNKARFKIETETNVNNEQSDSK